MAWNWILEEERAQMTTIKNWIHSVSQSCIYQCPGRVLRWRIIFSRQSNSPCPWPLLVHDGEILRVEQMDCGWVTARLFQQCSSSMRNSRKDINLSHRAPASRLGLDKWLVHLLLSSGRRWWMAWPWWCEYKGLSRIKRTLWIYCLARGHRCHFVWLSCEQTGWRRERIGIANSNGIKDWRTD